MAKLNLERTRRQLGAYFVTVNIMGSVSYFVELLLIFIAIITNGGNLICGEFRDGKIHGRLTKYTSK